MNALGKTVKKFFASKKAYELLDSSRALYGSTWTAGGCAVAARALHQLLPGSRLVTFVAGGVPQHVVVEHHGLYYDADGSFSPFVSLRRFKEREGYLVVVAKPFEPQHVRGDISCPVGLVRQVREELRKALL